MHTLRSRFLALAAGGCLAATGLVALGATSAAAATTFVVDNAGTGAPLASNCTTPVAGACRFVDAIAAAETTGGDVIISLAVPGGVVNANGNVWAGAPSDSLTIEGNGQTIDNPNASQTVRADSGASLTIDNVTLTSGYTTVTTEVPVTITNSTLQVTTNQISTTAQGIIASTDVSVTDSSITVANASDGDATGIVTKGPISLTGTTVTTTSANGGATAVQSSGGTINLEGSTVTATGPAKGVGIFAGNAVTLVNSTVANSSSYGIQDEGSVTLVYSDIIGNAQLPDTNNIASVQLVTFGSIIAQPGSGNANCNVDATTSQGYNYSDDADPSSSCELNAATDHVGSANDPLLGSLADNGGPTPTLLPASGSPVIDAIPAASCQSGGASGVTTDQRGLARPAAQVAGAPLLCDIGSVELQGPPLPVIPVPVALQPAFTG